MGHEDVSDKDYSADLLLLYLMARRRASRQLVTFENERIRPGAKDMRVNARGFWGNRDA